MRQLTRFDLNSGGVKGQEVRGADITSLNRLCWRGDSRGKAEIFEAGFRRRDDTAESFFVRQKSWTELEQAKVQHPGSFAGKNYGPESAVSRTGSTMMAPSLPHFRKEENDISPATAVCVASTFQSASLFPLKEAGVSSDTIWVYAVNLENGFDTYQMQANLGRRVFNFVQEACSHDIPPMHVLGAIQVSRSWFGETWQEGAMGSIAGPVASSFVINAKSAGCVGRAAKLDQARRQLDASLLGTKFMISP